VFQSASALVERQRYCMHGFEIGLTSEVHGLVGAIEDLLGEFSVPGLANKSPRLAGIIRPFDQREVLRHLSPTAVRITSGHDPIELYQEEERFWRIDDHWGICEINLLKGQWRSWVLPAPLAEPAEVVEHAVLWPISQLLSPRGLCVIPATAVMRDGWGALILSNFSVRPELEALVRAGYRVIGQNWTALREQDGRVVMLHIPGTINRVNSEEEHVDSKIEFCGCACDHANCDAILLIEPLRRPMSNLKTVAPPNALGELRRAWPTAELHPHRRLGQLIARMAQRCTVFDVQFSRNSNDILRLMDAARTRRPLPKVTVSVHVSRPGQRLVA
jgi:hypothetical protein